MLVVSIATVIGALVGFAVGRRARLTTAPSGSIDSIGAAGSVGSVGPAGSGSASPAGAADGGPVTGETLRIPSRTLLAAVDHLEMGVLVYGSDGEPLFRNERVDTLAGTHVGLLVDEHVTTIVAAALAADDGGPPDELVEVHGPPKQTLRLHARRTRDGDVVVTMYDVSERLRIDAMRTDFVANISHELRTPAGAVVVLAETLAEVDDPATRNDLAERLVDEAQRAVATIDDLLELSRIEAAPAAHEVVDVERLVAEAVARGRAAAVGRELSIAAVGPVAGLAIRGDRPQLVSALGNLVENAVKYSADGGAIQIRTRVDDRWIELMVADQGIGIPANDIDRVFERFYRVDKSRGRSTGGSGLGLAIVRHVAHNHGGEISVSSLEGEGSTFVLRLPARLVVSDRDAAAGAPVKQAEEGRR